MKNKRKNSLMWLELEMERPFEVVKTKDGGAGGTTMQQQVRERERDRESFVY